jgi:Predicted transcriptional regulators
MLTHQAETIAAVAEALGLGDPDAIERVTLDGRVHHHVALWRKSETCVGVPTSPEVEACVVVGAGGRRAAYAIPPAPSPAAVLSAIAAADRAPSPLAVSLRRARHRAGLTTRDLAAAAGVSPATVSRIETGASQAPRLRTLHRILTALEPAQ